MRYKMLFFSLLTNILINSVIAQVPKEISKADKVYGLSKFWQEVNYNFIFLDKVDRNKWEALYKKMIVDVQETSNDYEYYRLLQKFCASLKDGHTNIYIPEKIGKQIITTGFGDYRLFLTNIEGKAIITRVNASKKDEIPIGTEIVEVNGKPTKEYVKEYVTPYLSSSTEHVLDDNSIRLMLQGLIGTEYTLNLRLPNGTEKSLKLTHEITIERALYPPMAERELLDFKWLDNGIAYLSLNSFNEKEINSFFIEKLPELYQAKKLIIDLRYNGGGLTEYGRNILKYLTNDTILYGAREQSRLHIPTYKAWGKFQENMDTLNNTEAKKHYLAYRDRLYHDFPYQPDTIQLKAKRIVVPTAILIGHNTASAAEDFLIYADNQKHMIKMGEPTFGSTGQPLMFDMPSGGMARVCTKKDIYPDGREFIGVGILPDIEVTKTFDHYINDKDPVLDAAIEYLQTKE